MFAWCLFLFLLCCLLLFAHLFDEFVSFASRDFAHFFLTLIHFESQWMKFFTNRILIWEGWEFKKRWIWLMFKWKNEMRLLINDSWKRQRSLLKKILLQSTQLFWTLLQKPQIIYELIRKLKCKSFLPQISFSYKIR